MGNFKEELQRIRQTRFGAVPRVWPIGRALLPAPSAEVSTEAIRAVVLRWAATKWPGLIPKTAFDGQDFEVVQAGLSITALTIPDQEMWAFRSEHIDRDAARTWVSEAMVAPLPQTTVLGVRTLCSSLGSEEPPASMPRFLRDALKSHPFTDAGTLITDTPHYVRTTADAEVLLDILRHRGRALPVNVLTVGRHGEIALDAERLAQQLAGIAHVVVATSDATQIISDTFGAEWSVYNGAVRTYHTHFDPIQDDLYRHPLVLAARVATFHGPLGTGADAFHTFLVKSQHDRSTAPTNSFTDFPDFFAFKGRALAARATTAKDADLAPILSEQLKVAEIERHRWEDYAVEMAGKLDTATAQIAQLQAHNTSLSAALERLQARPAFQLVAAAPEPTAYADIAPWVETELAGKLILHARAVRGLKSAQYEDPGLVAQGLKLLANEFRDMRTADPDTVQEKRRALEHRLRELGLDRAGAISSDRASQFADEYFVEYVIGQKSRQQFEEHLSKGNSREERHCLRIYFFWDPEQKLVVVGSLPGHLRNRFT